MKKYLSLLFVFCLLFVASITTPVAAATQVCNAVVSFSGTTNDASGAIQNCINSAAANDIVELPAGKYYLAHQIKIENKPITFRTQGKTASMARCKYADSGCAELIATADIGEYSFLVASADNTAVDHIIFNGNKENRLNSAAANECRAGANGRGVSLSIYCDNCSFTNSVSKKALCGTGCGMQGNNQIIKNNLLAFNGTHNVSGLWADGLTVRWGNNSSITDNLIVNGSDVDLVVGGCPNCTIANNEIRHTPIFEGASFAGLGIHNFIFNGDIPPELSGNYTNSSIYGNKIDCGPQKRCGFGMNIGGNAWGQTTVAGGSFHDNSISNAMNGLVVYEAKNSRIYNNRVSNVSGDAYTKGPGSSINISGETFGASYPIKSWSVINHSCGNGCSASVNEAVFVSQNVPATMVAGQSYPVSVTMKNSGSASWSAANNYRLGSQNPQDNNIWGTGRINLANNESIDPIDSDTKTFNFNVAAPSTPGTYNFQWRMVQDGVEWFGDKTPNVAVTITSSCVSTCTTANAKQCSGNGVQTCTLSGGCLKWSTAVACGTGKICSGGACLASGACIPSGDQNSISNVLRDDGSAAVLCPNAVFNLTAPIVFTKPNQQIYTQGLPNGDSRALLRIANSNLVNAINGVGFSGIKIKNIVVDGNRTGLGYNDAIRGASLITVGGSASGQTIDHIKAYDTRGWSTLHIWEGNKDCTGAVVTNNEFSAAGRGNTIGVATSNVADGISLACKNSTVSNNIIKDATDGAIVIFCSPGSKITDNKIIAAKQTLQGGINMVDYGPWDGDYTGVVVSGNTITAAGAYVETGIAMGTRVWWCANGANRGAVVKDNVLLGDYFGYGFPVSGVSDWKVSGNVSYAKHSGITTGGCGYSPSTPAAFVKNNEYSSGSFQNDYTAGKVENVAQTTRLGVSIPAVKNNSTFVSQNVPTAMEAGKSYQISAVMKNTGNTIWTAGGNYKLGSQNTQDNTIWGTGRINLSSVDSIAVGDAKDFNFTVTAPSTPGTYNFQWQMVREGVEWFGSKTPNVAVTVTEGACTPACSAANAKQCSGNGVQTCTLTGGCLKWSAAIACGTGKTCRGGVCSTACVPKTCTSLGNYQCGSWSDGCSTTLNCGACASGQTCSNGKCVSNCISHSSKKCDSGDLYWYNSCNAKESLAQDCGNDQPTSIYRCNGSWTQRETIKKVCTNNACASESAWIDNADCAISGKRCRDGICITSCVNECIGGAKRCDGTTGFKTCALSNGCLKWGATTNCPGGQTCSGAGVCANSAKTRINAFNVSYGGLEAMGCGMDKDVFQHQACRASRWCISKGYATGFQTEWGNNDGTIQCVKTANSFIVSIRDLEAMGCGDDPDGFKHQACRAKRWCISKGFAAGFQAEWGKNDGTIQCVSAANIFEVAYSDLEAMGCDDDPDGFKHQACRAKRWCISKGFAAGFQTEWGVSSGGVFCLDKKADISFKDADESNSFVSGLQASLASISAQIKALAALFSSTD